MKTKEETLKDGTVVQIRSLTARDLDRLMEFYRDLPPEDRRYLKFDVTDREVVRERIRRMRGGHLVRVVAVIDDEIVGDGVLEFPEEGWKRDQVEMRVIVAHGCQHRGLGTLLMRELYLLAVAKGVHKIVAKIMRPQHVAIAIAHKLGFREQALLPDWVRDVRGQSQDLVVLVADIKEMWHELEWLYKDQDMGRWQ